MLQTTHFEVHPNSLSFRHDLLVSFDQGHDPLRVARDMLDYALTDTDPLKRRAGEVWAGLNDILERRPDMLVPDIRQRLTNVVEGLEYILAQTSSTWCTVIMAYRRTAR